MISLPTQFVKTIKDVHMVKGEKWLNDFDRLIDDCEKRWQMKIMPPFELSYNFVASAILNDGSEIVIKLAVPSDEFHAEAEALKLFNGNGMVKLLDVDPVKGILILERLIPGQTLASLENDEEATHIASQVAKKLWSPASHSSKIPNLKEREIDLINISKKYPEGLGPIAKEIIQEAAETFKYMTATMEKTFFLHGDFHHYNILFAGKDWVAIDPKGLIGDREYDLIQFLLNKLPNQNLMSVLDTRIDIFVEQLQLNKKRILAWGFAHAVLATCWSIEENGSYYEAFFNSINVFKQLHHLYYGSLFSD
ncbi:aminoglycoside phosphotransferase family protein [Heyndrickxia sp. NPDC080065]|uniref:aminoglycoside phosphotransferase family protein n=1 Tax=Heyndrickxia sp. NPDC080065 TaxID=3390568 RepID=UPI003D047DBE